MQMSNDKLLYLIMAFVLCSFNEHDFHHRSISMSKPEDLDVIESDWITRSGTLSNDLGSSKPNV